MLSAGIDIGAENIKSVVIKDDQLLAYSIVASGRDTNASLQRAFSEAAERSGLDSEAIKCVGATGMGRKSVSFATTHATDSKCSAKGAVWFIPSARTVIDIGAEQSQVLTCDSAGEVLEYVRNDSCAAGAGTFLEETASGLEVRIADMGELSLLSKREITINTTCVIFAESEVISLINEGANREDIVRGISDAIASKAASLLRAVNMEKDIVFIGGVARNIGIVHSLGNKLGLDVLVPEEPSIVTAVGAALIAQQS